MTTFVALSFTIPMSFALSVALVASTAGSFRTTLLAACNDEDGIQYWQRYSAIMLFLIPLLTGLLIGVGSIPESGVSPATGFSRILSSLLGGGFIALVGIGHQLSKHSQRMMHRRTTMSRSDY